MKEQKFSPEIEACFAEFYNAPMPEEEGAALASMYGISYEKGDSLISLLIRKGKLEGWPIFNNTDEDGQ